MIMPVLADFSTAPKVVIAVSAYLEHADYEIAQPIPIHFTYRNLTREQVTVARFLIPAMTLILEDESSFKVRACYQAQPDLIAPSSGMQGVFIPPGGTVREPSDGETDLRQWQCDFSAAAHYSGFFIVPQAVDAAGIVTQPLFIQSNSFELSLSQP